MKKFNRPLGVLFVVSLFMAQPVYSADQSVVPISGKAALVGGAVLLGGAVAYKWLTFKDSLAENIELAKLGKDVGDEVIEAYMKSLCFDRNSHESRIIDECWREETFQDLLDQGRKKWLQGEFFTHYKKQDEHIRQLRDCAEKLLEKEGFVPKQLEENVKATHASIDNRRCGVTYVYKTFSQREHRNEDYFNRGFKNMQSDTSITPEHMEHVMTCFNNCQYYYRWIVPLAMLAKMVDKSDDSTFKQVIYPLYDHSLDRDTINQIYEFITDEAQAPNLKKAISKSES